MLQGKIIREGKGYCVKVGSVTVDVTDDLNALIADERAKHDQALDALGTNHADALNRYKQIQNIVLAGGAGMPTG
jgi:hypothetical protein